MRVSNIALRFQPPSELIDSSKLKQYTIGRMSIGTASTSDSIVQNLQTSGVKQSNGNLKTASINGGDREWFHAVRDSIQKAHGGEMSREEVLAEMQRVFAKMEKPAIKKTHPLAVYKRTTSTFGITQTFPEYEKSTYEPDHQSGFGRVWIQSSSGKLQPVYVRTGLTDGKYTEIRSQKLKIGDQIVLSVTSTQDDNNQQTRSPLTMSQRGMRMGGGGPR